jgi:hypothetical protein
VDWEPKKRVGKKLDRVESPMKPVNDWTIYTRGMHKIDRVLSTHPVDLRTQLQSESHLHMHDLV